MDYLSFGEIRARIGHFMQTTEDNRVVLLKEIINDAYQDAATRIAWPELQKIVRMVAQLASGASVFTVPSEVRLLNGIWRATDGEELLWVQNTALMDRAAIIENTQGLSAGFAEVGSFAQKIVVAVAEKLLITFPAGGGSVTIQGLVAGDHVEETLATASTTITSANTYDAGLSILQVSTDVTNFPSQTAPRTGDIVVTGFTSALEYTRIDARQNTSRNRWFKVVPVSSRNEDLLVAYTAGVLPMVQDNDVPQIPISRYLIERGKADVAEHLNKRQSAQVHEIRAERIFSNIAMSRKGAERKLFQIMPKPGSFAGRRHLTVRQTDGL